MEEHDPNIQTAIRTLTLGGFFLEGADRKPGFASIFASRLDEFGVLHRYCFALFERQPVPEQIEVVKISASLRKSDLVIVSTSISLDIDGIPYIEWDRFVNLFGGAVFSYSSLEPEFSAQLKTLGHNKLPLGLEGRPDDLFEIYTRNALEFIFGCRVVRYGQDRRFEARPDGIIIRSSNFAALFDSKAYSEGYLVDETSIRQFKSYVEDFKRRYNQYFDINAFIVISGHFSQEEKTLEGRSRELQAAVNTPLIFLSTDVIADIINVLVDDPLVRRSINWRKIFVNPIIKVELVKEEISILLKDKIISK